MKRYLLLLPLLAACSNGPVISSLTPVVTSVITPYRIDVRQGNFVTQEMVAQLKPGLSREQVRFILGSPLIADMFHGNRWDYVYSYKQGHGEAQQRTLTVFFQDNKLTRVAGDVVAEDPATAEAPKSAARVIDIPGPGAAAAPADADKQEKK